MIRVAGVDLARAAYRIVVLDGEAERRALVPTSLLGGAGAPHQTAHEALARHAGPIRRAVAARAAGRTPRAPWDAVALEP